MRQRLSILYHSLRFRPRFYMLGAGVVCLYILAFFLPLVELFATMALLFLCALTVADLVLLYRGHQLRAWREVPERLSNGDENPLTIYLESKHPQGTQCTVIDEIPFQFQRRDLHFETTLSAGQQKALRYTLRPTERGLYSFGKLNVLCLTYIGLVQRHYRFDADQTVAVYPSFLQMRSYELLAATNRLQEVGVKRVRRLGQAREFDQIREYVVGDEYRNINWNATARKSDLMVNQYQDEKSQPIYSLIDMGRAMQLPFEGLSLLDYAINSSLVISNIAMLKDDKAGLITFGEKIESVLKAERGRGQLQKIMELLYNQRTRFAEANYEMLYSTVRRNVHQRSLLFLYTNFETLSSLQRQLPYLSMLSKSHVLCVIFFENTELRTLLDAEATTLEEIYTKTIAEKFAYEKKLIVGELERRGIHSLFTAPRNLSVNTINKYLELKARGVI